MTGMAIIPNIQGMNLWDMTEHKKLRPQAVFREGKLHADGENRINYSSASFSMVALYLERILVAFFTFAWYVEAKLVVYSRSIPTREEL